MKMVIFYLCKSREAFCRYMAVMKKRDRIDEVMNRDSLEQYNKLSVQMAHELDEARRRLRDAADEMGFRQQKGGNAMDYVEAYNAAVAIAGAMMTAALEVYAKRGAALRQAKWYEKEPKPEFLFGDDLVK